MSLSLKGDVPARNREVKPRTLTGTTLIVLGILGFIVSPIVGFVGAFLNPIVGIALWIGGSSFSGWLLARGKRYRAHGADDVLARDPRRPVLYLRSFGADGKAAEKVGRPLSIKGIDLTVPQTEEEQIASVVQRVGPLVAIGRPDENVPLLGAARMYVADDAWQGKVLDMMQRSSLVLMRAGRTEGFWWEVETAVRLVQPERLLWLVPFSGENYQTFAVRANTLLPKPLPLDPGKLQNKIGSFTSWIWFSDDWTPHVEVVPRPGAPQSSGYPVAMFMQYVLKPFYVRMGEVHAALYCSGMRRFAAATIDFIIFFGLVLLALLVGTSADGNSLGVLGILLIGLAIAYVALLDLPSLGGTVGKRVMRVRTVGKDGAPIGNGHTIVRGILKIPLLVIFPITLIYGGIVMGWSLRRRLLHDVLAGTYVIDPAW